MRGDEMGASKRNITIYSDYSEMGKTIKKRLVEKNMTATELADALGTSPQYLNYILHGQRSGKKYIKKIEEILGINIVA